MSRRRVLTLALVSVACGTVRVSPAVREPSEHTSPAAFLLSARGEPRVVARVGDRALVSPVGCAPP
ncbi:MAG TPA: hypothetical protein VIL20_25660 [Sandaracinaceae bacterium]